MSKVVVVRDRGAAIGFGAVLTLGCLIALVVMYINGRPNDLDQQTLLQGFQIYNSVCSSCHGARLQGAWQAGSVRTNAAPPLNDMGHAWQKSDLAISNFIDVGHETLRIEGESMLTDVERRQVMSFMKAHWTNTERVVQALVSLDFFGLRWFWVQPDWRFPPGCIPSRRS